MKKFKEWSIKAKIFGASLLVVYIFLWLVAGFVAGRKSAQAADIKSPIGSLINEDIAPLVADFANPINGEFFTKEEAVKWKNRLPLAVVIENHTDARPQSGLRNAEVVYETLAEGGITRLLAVYLARDTNLGPVRSNRAYFLDWVSEYSAGYSHVGGSPQAQQLVKTYNIRDLDQFFIGVPTYQRSTARFAPHNVYTSTQKLRAAAGARGYKGPIIINSWSFADEETRAETRPKHFVLDLGFSGTYGYNVQWVYNAKTNNYSRFNAEKKHIDATDNRQLWAKTIVAQLVKVSPDPSGHSRIQQATTGSGKALVFKNGKVVSGTWKKKSRTARTRFFNKKGEEIEFNRGRIWIEVVPSDSYIKYK